MFAASKTKQVSSAAVFVEDVMSTYLYTGTGATQTITNGIDLAGKGGLVWIKRRDGASNNFVFDTLRGTDNAVWTNATNAQTTVTNALTAFNSNGFSVGASGATNAIGDYASWTFRKQAKFFDVVTYTGTGANRTIAHNLGSTPGCIIVKRTDTTGNWQVYHNGLTSAANSIQLNLTNAQASAPTVWNSTAPTSTVFSVGTDATVNASGGTYVAYLFAHNAGGFGLTGTDNVISCGSFTTDASGNATVTLGYEPQFLITKLTNALGSWDMFDSMRGLNLSSTSRLSANTSNGENNQATNYVQPNATGFAFVNGFGGPSNTFIYIAIRRGPMRTPTSGTEVFTPDAGTNGTSGGIVTTNFPVDFAMTAYRSLGGVAVTNDRLRGFGIANSAGVTPVLRTSSTSAESSFSGQNPYFYNAWNTTITRGSNGANPGGAGIITWFLCRAPGFFDVVCYTGTGIDNTQITHNLGVAPELIITKNRSSTGDWWTLCTADATRRVGRVNLTNPLSNSGIASAFGNGTAYVAPTTSVFTLGSGATSTNTSGATYVAYLFASCPGVSKVGSYTGTGATQTISCGFTGGARFVLIKRTDSTGDWYVWDTARGMVSGTDPSLLLNSSAAEVNANSVYTTAGGFQIVSTAAGINASGGTYLFFAVS